MTEGNRVPELIDLGRNDATLDVVALPHAGAGVAALYPLAMRLRADGVAVRVVRLPGRETRLDDPPLTSVDALVAAVAPLVDGRRPYVLFGHSTGALFAYAIGRKLALGPRAPRGLIVSGRRAPHLPDHRAPIHDRPDAEFRAGVEKLSGEAVPELHDPETWEIAEPALRADIGMDERYAWTPAPPLPFPITALRGTAARNVPDAELDAWRQHTSSAFGMRAVEGGHFYVRDNPDGLARAVLDSEGAQR